MRDFVEHHFRHFNAGELRRCAESLRDFIAEDGRLMITLGGAMSTAEIGVAWPRPFEKEKFTQSAVRAPISRRICSI